MSVRKDPRVTPGTVARRLAVVVALIVAVAALVAVDPNALCMLPALLLAVPLLLRRYPGERLLSSVSCVKQPRRVAALGSQPPRTVVKMMPRGGLLIARSLAVRPPPPL
ncbi:MAG TPA: hypothetical protein VFR48_04275, partial [Solirubrobacteraceae bacterium]|nr:hypothetical protein [Solirubrobacteraceae bacterium]